MGDPNEYLRGEVERLREESEGYRQAALKERGVERAYNSAHVDSLRAAITSARVRELEWGRDAMITQSEDVDIIGFNTTISNIFAARISEIKKGEDDET